MTPSYTFSRRRMLTAVAAMAVPTGACARNGRQTALTVFKTPTCPCCDGWIGHMRQAGFEVSVQILADLRPVRRRLGLPEAMASCHSGLVGGYLIEGHVTSADVRTLLRQRPEAIGLAVPAMPLGSPGMETPNGQTEPYDTLLVLRSGQTTVFARHNLSV